MNPTTIYCHVLTLLLFSYSAASQINCCVLNPTDAEKFLNDNLEPIAKFGDNTAINTYFPAIPSSDYPEIIAFNKFLKTILKKDKELKATKGSIGFGLSLDEANGQKLTKLYSKLTLTKGSYPSELEFNSEIDITAQNGVLQENLSRLFVSHDYHMNSNIEFFSFLSRYNDKFLNIDSRYEIGAGFVFDFQERINNNTLNLQLNNNIKRIFTSNLRHAQDINQLDFPNFDTKPHYNDLFLATVKTSPININDFTQRLDCLQNATVNGFYKQVLPVRFAILLGVFYEMETVSLTKTLVKNIVVPPPANTVKLEDPVELSLKTADMFRFEIRPTLDIKLGPEAFILKIRPYFKLPFTLKETSKTYVSPIENPPGSGIFETITVKKYDWRFDGRVELKMKVNPFSTTISYDLVYDNLPQREYLLSNKLDVAGFATANNLHHIVRFAFGFEF